MTNRVCLSGMFTHFSALSSLSPIAASIRKLIYMFQYVLSDASLDS